MKKIMAMMAGVTVAVAAGAREFALEEHFGVSHPEQIVTFDVPEGFETKGVTVSERRERADGNAASAALRPSVPFQFVDGGRKLAVKTGLLPGERVTWGVEQGKAAFDAKGLVTVRELPSDAWEVDNGLIAIRVPRFSGWTATSYADAEVKPLVNIFNTSLQEAYWPRQVVLAPVQGVRLADGTWTGIGPNTLMALAKETLGISAEVVEAGPLRVVIKIRYEFIHTEISGGRGEKVTMPEGPGFYETTVTMDAGQPSVLFEEETDMNVAWGMNVYEGVAPTQARWRGHHASRVEYGRKSDGSIYNGYNYGDAMTDLQYERAQVPNYNTSENTWRYLVVWDPWAYDSGWYWLAYNSDQWSVVSGQQDGGNLVGIFAGRASRAIGAAISGAGIFTLPEDPRTPGKKCFGIAVQTARNSPDARFFTHTRFQWGLYSAALSALRPPEEVQDINVQMNIHGGVNLDKASRWVLDFPDPPDGYGTTYMGRKGIDVLRQRTKDEDPAYYRWLYNNDTYSRILYDAWREEGREKYDECVEQTLQAGHNMMENLVNQGGIYNMSVHYWHGGLEAMRYGVWIDQLLNDPRLTPEQEAKLKATAVMFASIVWDDDHSPISSGIHGLNLGTENMPVQQWGYRRFYALFMARHPTMAERAPQVVASLESTVEQVVNDAGAQIGCPHYIGASFVPTLNSLLQVKRLGAINPFKEWPKLAKFAEFFLNLQTPPDPRRQDRPILLVLGDSGIETSEMFGLVGTGLAESHPELSANMMAAWDAGGKQHSFFFGTTVAMIDDDLPRTPRPLADASFPGYYTVLRNGWGTPDETALFFVNGDFQRDHRHRDQGSIVLYALGKPISTDWSAIYTPQAPGPYMHSMVVPEKALPFPWDKDGVPIGDNTHVWWPSQETAFSSTPDVASSTATFTGKDVVWTRRVTVHRALPETPVAVIRDTFEGDAATDPKIISFNLMATGGVTTAKGVLTPPERFHPQAERQDNLEMLPSALPPVTLDERISRWDFTGYFDVDFTVFTIGAPGRLALLGNWGNLVNTVRAEERQHILRVRDTGPVTTVIVPWRQRAKPTIALREDGDTLVVTVNAHDILIK